MEEQRKPRRWLMWLAVGLPFLLVAYPMSVGPFAWMVRHRWIPQGSIIHELIAAAYSPLFWLIKLDAERAGVWFEWYVDHWR